jgi:hypothetical protein
VLLLVQKGIRAATRGACKCKSVIVQQSPRLPALFQCAYRNFLQVGCWSRITSNAEVANPAIRVSNRGRAPSRTSNTGRTAAKPQCQQQPIMKVIVIAGTHSGVGKTSLTTGLMQALRCAAIAISQYCCCRLQRVQFSLQSVGAAAKLAI